MNISFRSLAALAFVLLPATSCIKPVKEESAPLGPEVSQEKLELELMKALYMNPRDIEVGQMAFFDANLRLENQDQVQPIGTSRVTVINKFENDKALCFILKVEIQEAGKAPAEPVQEEMVFWKVAPDDSQPCTTTPGGGTDVVNQAIPTADIFVSTEIIGEHLTRTKALTGSNLLTAKQTVTPLKDVIRTTYHGLIVESGTVQPPPAVRNRADCGGVPDCVLPVTRIQFDQADWTSKADYDVKRHNLVISKSAPYLAAILDRCIAGGVPVDGRNYFVRQCEFVMDFKFR